MAVGLFGRQEGLNIELPDIVFISCMRSMSYEYKARLLDLVKSLATVGITEIIIVGSTTLQLSETSNVLYGIKTLLIARPDVKVRIFDKSMYDTVISEIDTPEVQCGHIQLFDFNQDFNREMLKTDWMDDKDLFKDTPSLVIDYNMLEVVFAPKPALFIKKRYDNLLSDVDRSVNGRLNEDGVGLLGSEHTLLSGLYYATLTNLAVHMLVKPNDNREPYVVVSAFKLLRQVPLKIMKTLRVIPTWDKKEK